MPEYLIAIYEDEEASLSAAPDVVEEILAGHRRFMDRHGGAVRGGNRLRGTATATSIRHGAQSPTITDGAFAETKEALGGYYLVEAADLDEALRIARDVPAPFGGVEVRPIWPASEG
jgi:hypothetical protein